MVKSFRNKKISYYFSICKIVDPYWPERIWFFKWKLKTWQEETGVLCWFSTCELFRKNRFDSFSLLCDFFFSKHLLGQWIGWPPTHQLASLHCPQREENFSQQDGSHWNHVSDKHYKFQHVPNTSNHKTSLPQSTTHKSLVVLRVVFCQFLDKNDYEEQSLQLFTLLCG